MAVQNKVRILYVDDSVLDRELVRDALEREHGGFSVTEAGDRDAFLSCLRNQTYDLILSDFDILGFQGLEVLEFVRENDPLVPVIIVTGTGSEQIAVEAIKRGAADYVIKSPRHIRRLPFTISAALRSRRLAEERHHAYEALQQREQELKMLNASLEERVRERTAALEETSRSVRALASALTLSEQTERKRFSHLLHEDLQQRLNGIKMRTQALKKVRTDRPDALPEHVDLLLNEIERAISMTRTVAVELNPPVLRSEGLPSALTWLANHMQDLHNLRVTLDIEPLQGSLREDRRILLVQLVRELLFNVVQHAGVDQAALRLSESNGGIVIEVSDSGVGFDVATALNGTASGPTFGLFSVRERMHLLGGRLDIESTPGAGSRATLYLPLE